MRRDACEGVSHIPTLTLLVSIYQWCPGGLETLPGQDQGGLCLPSSDFFYSYFQNQMAGYGNSEKAAGIGGRTLVLHCSKGKCAYTARVLSARAGTRAHVNSSMTHVPKRTGRE